MGRVRGKVGVRVKGTGGGIILQADPQCINAQRMHTNYIVSRL